ncbi:hypothetical protein Vretimale_5657 [Volvox reticuliferus]|uniref:Uncharacterized protein n=1 Tax=Volvox reticuliferus TaxID=1737510 RepID=A0A8J4G5X9_9CHLO|nr:hypothetical protein Vretifemale_5637 [Volvox reticuliferus]GIM00707.1 hypothetical protein Vretimale_5657 [Volvox reticuliferus]
MSGARSTKACHPISFPVQLQSVPKTFPHANCRFHVNMKFAVCLVALHGDHGLHPVARGPTTLVKSLCGDMFQSDNSPARPELQQAAHTGGVGQMRCLNNLPQTAWTTRNYWEAQAAKRSDSNNQAPTVHTL